MGVLVSVIHTEESFKIPSRIIPLKLFVDIKLNRQIDCYQNMVDSLKLVYPHALSLHTHSFSHSHFLTI